MNILILGNGFDLAHKLDTKYVDFLNYCRKNQNVENIWLRHFVNRQQKLGEKWIDLEEEIYNVIKSLNESLKYLTNNYEKESISRMYSFQKDFIDEKFDLSRITNEFRQSQNKYPTNEKEYTSVNTNIVNYVGYYFKTYKGLINFLYDQLRNFTNQFNNYLLAEVLPNIGNKKYDFPLAKGKTIRVLNFNYTDTYAKLYNQHSIYAEENPRYIYVHGKVCDSKNCNLILGTHSFYNNLPNDLNEEINVEFNVFKKHNQRHRYGTIEPYQELLKELNDRRKIIVPSFHIIGHSLDKSDHNILRHIFKAREKCNIYIYYHNQEALNRLINNITEIIGEEEVMTKVKFIDQEDKNRGVFKPSQKSSLITT